MRLLGAAGLLMCLGHKAEACSKLAFPQFRSATAVNFIGTASDDTLLAGAGPVKFATIGKLQPIFGQLVRVERVSAVGPAALSATAVHGSLDVVLVPWTYGGDCTPMRWDRSARWITARTRGLFSGTLRDQRDWIDGRPTIDVHDPYHTPYLSVAAAGGGLMLTPDEALDLLGVLPLAGFGRSERAVRVANAPLLHWARDHPALATRSPARDLLYHMRYSIAEAIVEEKRNPVAGTYRFVIMLPQADSMIFFARSEAFPMTALWNERAAGKREETADGLPKSYGYSVLAQAAASERELTTNPYLEDEAHRQGYFTLADDSVAVTPDSTMWRGSVDLVGAAVRLARDAHMNESLHRVETEIDELIRSGRLSFTEGRFIKYANGRVRFETRVSGAAGLVFAMHGERISPEILTQQ